ncbi:MAG: sigma-54-dependent Fis family transcriptional regulator [Acidobacteria bacterium]|nr:sigma-54-dependent Fis family transcriptional regulator [Acidobacteriota bacterium]
MTRRVLIVDDEEAARYGIRRALSREGYALDEAGSTYEARRRVAAVVPDVILLDVNLPGESGLEYLSELAALPAPPLVVIITAHGNERMAVDAIKGGAHDYISKPFEVDDLRIVVKNAVETVALRQENRALRTRLAGANGFGSMIGKSEGMQRVFSTIEKVADTDVTVLIRGESGTGKELVAQEVHRRSGHRTGEFVAMNCAAMPAELIESELFGHEKGAFTGAAARRKGKFEAADGGTIFLDEIGDMSVTTQAKVLRVLEGRVVERLGGDVSVPVDVRVVSATHKNLEAEIAEGRFRQDLYYRLRVVTIELPPLRDRRDDIPLLANDMLNRYASLYGLRCRDIEPAAMRRLVEYQWPGNVRELRNAIERAVVLAGGETLTEADLSAELTTKAGQPASSLDVDGDVLTLPFVEDFREARKEFERAYIEKRLAETGGNVTRAAELLEMHRQSLQHKLRELGIRKKYSVE